MNHAEAQREINGEGDRLMLARTERNIGKIGTKYSLWEKNPKDFIIECIDKEKKNRATCGFRPVPKLDQQ